MANTDHEGDIILTGDDVLVIEDTTYTQTGNIYVRDNARLTIQDATLIFNQRYHEEFAIWIQGNGTFEVKNSTIKTGILPEENFVVHVSDEAYIVIRDSNLKTGKGYLSLSGTFSGSATIFNSQFHYLTMGFSSSGGSTISVRNSEINIWEFRFDDYQGDFSDLKPGFLDSWSYNQGSYSITVENTNIIMDMGLHCDGPSQIVVRNSHFFQLGSTGLSTISLKLVDSIIRMFSLHGFSAGCTVQLSNLKTGLHSQWSLRDHATGDCIPDVVLENTEITDGWGVTSFGATLSINNSDLTGLGSYGSSGTSLAGNITSVSSSTIEQLMFYYSEARLILDNTTIREVSVYLPSSPVIEGDIKFAEDALISDWLDSTITREFPVLVQDASGSSLPDVNLELYSPQGELIWSGTSDAQGKATFEITFDDSNYQDTWTLVGPELDISKEVKFLIDTPIKIQPYMALGDVTGDGNITMEDAQLVAEFALELKTPTDAQKEAADVAKPFAAVDIRDATAIPEVAQGIRSGF